MIKNYEGMFVIKPDLEKDPKKKAADFISNAITKELGEVKDLAEWGKHRLAYKIKRFNEGLYILAHFSLSSDKLDKVQKVYNLNEDILKTLIIIDETTGDKDGKSQ